MGASKSRRTLNSFFQRVRRKYTDNEIPDKEAEVDVSSGQNTTNDVSNDSIDSECSATESEVVSICKGESKNNLTIESEKTTKITKGE